MCWECGSGANDAWVVGLGGTTCAGQHGLFQGVDGKHGPSAERLGSGPSEVWAVGENGTILRWNGTVGHSPTGP